MQDIQRLLGARVRKLREQKGLSQEALGDLCGINRSHMGEIERGELNLSLGTLVKMAQQLEISVSKLLKGIA